MNKDKNAETGEAPSATGSNPDIESTTGPVSPRIDPRGLRFAPPEVRHMIFRYAVEPQPMWIYLPVDYVNRPTLWKYLEKEDEQLYHEALDLWAFPRRFYYSTCPTSLPVVSRNKEFDDSVLEHVRMLTINSMSVGAKFLSFQPFQIFEKATEVRDFRLQIRVSSWHSQGYDNSKISSTILEYVQCFPKLKKLTVHLALELETPGVFDGIYCEFRELPRTNEPYPLIFMDVDEKLNDSELKVFYSTFTGSTVGICRSRRYTYCTGCWWVVPRKTLSLGSVGAREEIPEA